MTLTWLVNIALCIASGLFVVAILMDPINTTIGAFNETLAWCLIVIAGVSSGLIEVYVNLKWLNIEIVTDPRPPQTTKRCTERISTKGPEL